MSARKDISISPLSVIELDVESKKCDRRNNRINQSISDLRLPTLNYFEPMGSPSNERNIADERERREQKFSMLRISFHFVKKHICRPFLSICLLWSIQVYFLISRSALMPNEKVLIDSSILHIEQIKTQTYKYSSPRSVYLNDFEYNKKEKANFQRGRKIVDPYPSVRSDITQDYVDLDSSDIPNELKELKVLRRRIFPQHESSE